MVISPRKYVIIHTLIAVVAAVTCYLLCIGKPHKVQVVTGWVGIALQYILFMASFYWVNSQLKGASGSFMSALLSTMMLKLLIGVGYVALVLFWWISGLRKEVFDKVLFVILYFGPYFLFSAFEIYSLMNNLRADSKKP